MENDTHVLFRGRERVEKVDSAFRAVFRHFTGDYGQKAELTFWRQIAQNGPSKHSMIHISTTVS